MNPFTKHIFRWLLLLQIAAFSLPALADATGPAPEGGAFFSNLEAAAQQISHRFNSGILTQLSARGLAYAENLREPALAIAGALALVYLMYETLMFLGSKNGSMLTVLFDVGVPAIIGALLISNYAANINMFNDLLGVFRGVAGDSPSQIMTFYGSVLRMVTAAITTSFSTLGAALISLNISGSVSAAIDLFLTVIFVLVILFIVFSSMAEVLGLLLLGPFLYAVGIAFGPLLIAGIVTPWTREYVTKWIGFIVLSALLTGVLTVILSIATTVFTTLGFTEFSTGRPTAATLGMVAIMLMAVNSLIQQAPSIASAMVPGSLGARSGGGQTVTSGVQKAGRQAAGGVTRSASGKTGGIVSAGMSKLVKKAAPKPPTP